MTILFDATRTVKPASRTFGLGLVDPELSPERLDDFHAAMETAAALSAGKAVALPGDPDKRRRFSEAMAADHARRFEPSPEDRAWWAQEQDWAAECDRMDDEDREWLAMCSAALDAMESLDAGRVTDFDMARSGAVG